MFRKLALISIAIVLGAMAATSSAEARPHSGPPENKDHPVSGRVHAPDGYRGGPQNKPRDRPDSDGHDGPRGPHDRGQRDNLRYRPDLNSQDGPRDPREPGNHDDRRGPGVSGHGQYKNFQSGGDGPRGKPTVGGPPGQGDKPVEGGPPGQRGGPTMGRSPSPHDDLAPGAPSKGHHNRQGRGNEDAGSFDQRPRPPQRLGNLRNLSVHDVKTN